MSRLTLPPVPEDVPASLGGRAAAWLGLRTRRDGPRSLDAPFLQFADILSEAPTPRAIAEGLTRIAFEISGARRVELIRERGWGAATLATWPTCEVAPDGPTKRSTMVLRNEDWLEGRSPMLGIPARHGGRTIATLWLYADRPRRWPTELVRTLTSLATLAASSGFAPEETTEPLTSQAHDLATGLPNSSFLEAFLTYAVAQAKRKHEPLSMMCVGIDRLEAIYKLHGPQLTRDASKFVARVIASTLRASDLVARLDDARLIAVLPNARYDDALLIAETLSTAISEAGQATTAMPLLTSSLGVVAYPDHAPDAPTLLHAASEALVEARAKGPRQIYGPPLPGAGGHLKVAQCVG